MKNNFSNCKFIKAIKKVKLRTLVILIVLLVFNSYAWFIYSTKVATGMNAHVSAWNVIIKAGEGETSNLEINLDRIYPGMDTFEKTVEVTNKSEVPALLGYEIKGYNILGVDHEENESVSSADLQNQLINDYPFKVSIELSSTKIDAQNGSGTYTVKVSWPFESGDDSKDTYWGEQAYEYFSTHPNEKSLHVDILLSVEQATE